MKNKINFLKVSPVFILFSLACVVFVFFSLFTKGINYGTDFTGGMEIVLEFDKKIDKKEIIKLLTSNNKINVEIEEVLSNNVPGIAQEQGKKYTIRSTFLQQEKIEDKTKGKKQDKKNSKKEDVNNSENKTSNQEYQEDIATSKYILKKLSAKYPNYKVLTSRSVGSVLSSEYKSSAVWSSIFIILLIVGYVAFRFNLGFGVATIIAVVHDILIMVGIISFFSIETNILTIFAVLTILGYSVNDTIVFFDRVRENIFSGQFDDFKALLNQSINNVISRSLITSLTTSFVIGTLYYYTEGTYKNFALIVAVGIFSGTYSSLYIATWVARIWNTRKPFLKN